MLFVPKLDRFSSDLFVPGRFSDPVGFIVGDGVIEGLHGDITPAISVTAVRQAALRYEQLGLVDAEDYANAQAEAEAAREEVHRLQAENEKLNDKLDGIVGLRREGFVIQKRQGRPPKKEAAKA